MKTPLILAAAAVVIVAAVFFAFGGGGQGQPTRQAATSSVKMIPGYSGAVLAGESSPYLEFTKADYEKALAENKIIILDFYANWCPICRAEAPSLLAGFESLTADNIVGFRVNFNDSDTDSDERELAGQFKIPYQHTKVILKNGQEVKRSGEQWDRETFDREVGSVL